VIFAFPAEQVAHARRGIVMPNYVDIIHELACLGNRPVPRNGGIDIDPAGVC
jgi:hypothetical protein